MTHSGHARQQVLHAADPETIVERIAARNGERGIGVESRLKIGNPFARVVITVAPFEPRLRVQFEVLVRVDQTREHEALFDVDNGITFIWCDADAVDTSAFDANRARQAAVGSDDLGIDERNRC
jgi:hypothetical protein